jgi:ketosteroid isomerase-like protein
MSQENVEVMRAAYEAWNAGDMDALRDMHDPTVIARFPEGWPESGPFVGREAVMRQIERCARPGTPMQRKRSPTSSTLATEFL